MALSGCDSLSLPSWAGGDDAENASTKSGVDGERISILKNSVDLQPDPSLAALPYALPARESENPPLAAPLSQHDDVAAGEGESFKHQLTMKPLVADGAVFAMDASGAISAHDAKNIDTVRWVTRGLQTEDEDAILGGGLAYASGVLYAASGKGLVAAYNAANGAELWRQPLNIPIRSAPLAASGRVYVVTVDSQFFALDATKGGVLWSHRGINEGKGFLVEASPVAEGERVVVPYASGEIHVLNVEDGSEAWADTVIGPQRQSAISQFTGIGGDPVVADGVLYVASGSGMLAAFQLETGRRLWDQPISSLNRPWVAADDLFVLTSESVLLAFNRFDGRVRWKLPLPRFENESSRQNPYTWNGPVLAGGRLLVVGAHGELLEISPAEGKVTNTLDIPDHITTAPVVAGGVAYMMSDDSRLHAFY